MTITTSTVVTTTDVQDFAADRAYPSYDRAAGRHPWDNTRYLAPSRGWPIPMLPDDEWHGLADIQPLSAPGDEVQVSGGWPEGGPLVLITPTCWRVWVPCPRLAGRWLDSGWLLP